MCIIYLVLKVGRKYTDIGLEMGVTISGGAAKSGSRTHLLLIMHVSIS